jgi:hypothetical protein
MSREPEVSDEDFARIIEAFHRRFPTPYCLYRDDYDSWREENGEIPQGLHLFVELVEAIKTCGERAAARAIPAGIRCAKLRGQRASPGRAARDGRDPLRRLRLRLGFARRDRQRATVTLLGGG